MFRLSEEGTTPRNRRGSVGRVRRCWRGVRRLALAAWVSLVFVVWGVVWFFTIAYAVSVRISRRG